MLSHIIDFVVDYFTNLTVRKILGGILVLVGMAVIERIGLSGAADTALVYMLVGVLIAGVGLAIIYYDMAQDKTGRSGNDLELIVKTHQREQQAKKKDLGWHMDSPTGTDQPEGKAAPKK